MELKPSFVLLAEYNQKLNKKVYDTASTLENAELSKDRGAFFGSIIGTLNHILVADLIWLNRFSRSELAGNLLIHAKKQPKPISLDDILYHDIFELYKHRKIIDCEVIELMEKLDDSSLSTPFTYTNSKGIEFTKKYSYLLLHFFNHQTHHRGQVTTLLSQEGIDVGVTDLLAIIPNEK
jgi:uncharacterized damage-inducible protein DinB